MTAIMQLKEYLIKTIFILEDKQRQIYKDKNEVYGFHGGISDEVEDERRYRELEIQYAKITGQIEATQGVLGALNTFAVHPFIEAPDESSFNEIDKKLGQIIDRKPLPRGNQ